MDNFIVSARKYRPQTFDTVVGQSHITTTLKNAIRNRQLAHAFLFCGPRGVGKTTCARILAKTINCENLTPEGEACNTCESCRSFNEGASINYFELDAASNNSVDDIRELVTQVRFVPQRGQYKVYVIDEVHMLSSAAFNAFLKTLEEPPSYAIFILATTEKHKILPTILSRCQIFDFKRITTQDTVEHLEDICSKENIEAEKAALHLIAQKSEGCMRDALSILDKIVSFTNGELQYANTLEHLNVLDEDYYFRLLQQLQDQDLSGALLLYDDINRKGFEGDLVLNGFAEFIRNLLVCQDPKAAALLDVVDSFRERYRQTATGLPPALLISALNILSEAEIQYKAARNKRLHVELTLIKLCYLPQALRLTAQGDQLTKKKILTEARALNFRALRPFAPEPAPETGARLVIETPAPAPKSEADKATRQPPPPAPVEETRPAAPVKISALSKIRKQFAQPTGEASMATDLPLQADTLQAAWNEYVEKLRAAKNPAAQPFQLAELRICEPHIFEAIVGNNIEKQFIEQERSSLFLHLQEKLRNRQLQYSVVVEERNGDKPVLEPTLTSREQFQKMSELFPQVKELRDRLKLDLDY